MSCGKKVITETLAQVEKSTVCLRKSRGKKVTPKALGEIYRVHQKHQRMVNGFHESKKGASTGCITKYSEREKEFILLPTGCSIESSRQSPVAKKSSRFRVLQNSKNLLKNSNKNRTILLSTGCLKSSRQSPVAKKSSRFQVDAVDKGCFKTRRTRSKNFNRNRTILLSTGCPKNKINRVHQEHRRTIQKDEKNQEKNKEERKETRLDMRRLDYPSYRPHI